MLAEYYLVGTPGLVCRADIEGTSRQYFGAVGDSGGPRVHRILPNPTVRCPLVFVVAASSPSHDALPQTRPGDVDGQRGNRVRRAVYDIRYKISRVMPILG